MAAGYRNKKGKSTDFVRHYCNQENSTAICGNKRAGYVSNDVNDVTCVKCTVKLLNTANQIVKLTKGLFPVIEP